MAYRERLQPYQSIFLRVCGTKQLKYVHSANWKFVKTRYARNYSRTSANDDAYDLQPGYVFLHGPAKSKLDRRMFSQSILNPAHVRATRLPTTRPHPAVPGHE